MSKYFNSNIKINKKRLIKSIYKMAKIGQLNNGGCRRLAFSEEDFKAKKLLINWCTEIGLNVSMDPIGNLFAELKGKFKKNESIGIGSHLDTQPHGGKFDGAYGVLAGLEVIRTLVDNNIVPPKSIKLINWSNEEGCRFTPPLMGSSVYVKSIKLNHALKTLDKNHLKIENELQKKFPQDIKKIFNHKLESFIEIHIEQGPILEKSKKCIGIVTGAQGSRGLDVIIKGQDAHSGTTPMNLRKDTLIVAANFIQLFDKRARNLNCDLRATVGNILTSPGSRNTISGYTFFTIDIRHPRSIILDKMETCINKIASDLIKKYKISINIKKVYNLPTVNFNTKIQNIIENACNKLNYTRMKMISGAGHDAMSLAEKIPTGMIFIPCLNGISHNEKEHASDDDLEAGCNVLLHTILKLNDFKTIHTPHL